MELLSHMKPGDVLTDADLGSHVSAMGIGVAEAQKALDYNTLNMLGEFTEPLPALDNKSLLALGLSPPFYHFRSAMLSCSVSMSLRVVEAFGGKLNLPGKGPVGGADAPVDPPATTLADGEGGAGGNPADDTPTAPANDTVVPEVLKGIGASASLLDIRYSRMFDLSTSGNMSITAELVSIPAPPEFLTFIKEFLEE